MFSGGSFNVSIANFCFWIFRMRRKLVKRTTATTLREMPTFKPIFEPWAWLVGCATTVLVGTTSSLCELDVLKMVDLSVREDDTDVRAFDEKDSVVGATADDPGVLATFDCPVPKVEVDGSTATVFAMMAENGYGSNVVVRLVVQQLWGTGPVAPPPQHQLLPSGSQRSTSRYPWNWSGKF